MKKIILMMFFMINLFGWSMVQAKETQSLDQIVAVVNDDVITKSEFNHAVQRMRLQIAQMHSPIPSDTELQKQALDQVIGRRLQLQIAKQNNVEVTDKEINQAISRIAEQNNMSVDTMYERIAQDGISKTEYRSEFREQMMMQKVQQREFAGKLNLSQQEVTNFMRSKPWQTNALKEYRIEDILIPTTENASRQDIASAKELANTVINKLNQGSDFRQVAALDSTRIQEGDLGWRKLIEIPSAFAEQVAQMKAKQVAGPIQTSNGFHIIRLAEVRDLESVKAPDRKQVENMLMQRKFEEAIQGWVSKLRSQAFIVINPEKQNA